VEDPEIHRPITDLGMVKSVDIDGDRVKIGIYLTVSGCPMKDTITQRVTLAVGSVRGVKHVDVDLDVMSDAQRKAMREKLQGGPEKEIPFTKPGNQTHIYAITSGKGGVGKSSVTVNLAVAMAAQGLKVGIVDADIYGHSIPGLLGITAPPTVVEGMIMPSEAYGVRAISMLPFKPGGSTEPVAFRGPMLHRALQQFLTDVWRGASGRATQRRIELRRSASRPRPLRSPPSRGRRRRSAARSFRPRGACLAGVDRTRRTPWSQASRVGGPTAQRYPRRTLT
jgi:ATP-binding protein involved in chromosome partitioning